MTTLHRSAAQVRAEVGHPVVDFDGHTIEFLPAFFDVLADIGGPAAVDRLQGGRRGVPGQRSNDSWYDLTPSQRRSKGLERPSWWNFPTARAIDRASSTVPRLLYSRLDELGFDYGLLYPSAGLSFIHLDDEELRIAACSALNSLHAEMFAPYTDRLTPVAVVPMHTPEEAVAELRHAVTDLGLKTALIPSYVKRSIDEVVDACPAARAYAFRLDTFGIDSEYDYDVVWQTCLDLGVGPATHSPGRGFGTRSSSSNYCYNHVGHFAAAAEAVCKSLVFGGVPRRFPSLRFAFLEGGPAWAASLVSDLKGHFEKRNLASLRATLDPERLDRDEYRQLLEVWADGRYARLVEQGQLGLDLFMRREPEESLDEWAASGITTPSDIDAIFATNFWIGCEADDAMNRLAFGAVPGVRLNAVLGSDIGHWDVPDFREVLPELAEALEEGAMTADDFADFTYRNAIRFLAGANSSFFDGTILETPARVVMGERRQHATIRTTGGTS
jgi:predicted TIM-barrel fold metal-dependent hydrolase